MTELVDILRGKLNNCSCHAWGQGECGCDAVWPESHCGEAADEIERLNKLLTRTPPEGMVNLAMSGETVKLICRAISLEMGGDPDKVFPSGKTVLEAMEPVAIKVIEALLDNAPKSG